MKAIMRDLKRLVDGDIESSFFALGKVAEKVSGGSALHSLEVVSFAFAALLDVYAKPNANNPQGMCDDPRAFRRHFAEIIARGGDARFSSTPKRPKKKGGEK